MPTLQNIRSAAAMGGTGSPDILQTMLIGGKSNQEIANAMGTDVRTVVWALAQPAPVVSTTTFYTATGPHAVSYVHHPFPGDCPPYPYTADIPFILPAL